MRREHKVEKSLVLQTIAALSDKPSGRRGFYLERNIDKWLVYTSNDQRPKRTPHLFDCSWLVLLGRKQRRSPHVIKKTIDLFTALHGSRWSRCTASEAKETRKVPPNREHGRLCIRSPSFFQVFLKLEADVTHS